MKTIRTYLKVQSWELGVQSDLAAGQPTGAEDLESNEEYAALINAPDETESVRHEFNPFVQTLRTTGPLGFSNLFRFSTKYADV